MPRRWAWAAFLGATACGPSQGEPAGKVWYAYDYAPEFGASFTYVQPGVTSGDALHLFVGNGSWDVRRGVDYATGTPVATWVVSADNETGLVVDGSMVLPGGFEEGDTFENGVVSEIAERKVEIGTFSEVVTVDLDGGPLAGEAAFVVGTGPVVLTVTGNYWEVSAYTLP